MPSVTRRSPGTSLPAGGRGAVSSDIKGFEAASLVLRIHIGIQLRPETEMIESKAAQKYVEFRPVRSG